MPVGFDPPVLPVPPPIGLCETGWSACSPVPSLFPLDGGEAAESFSVGDVAASVEVEAMDEVTMRLFPGEAGELTKSRYQLKDHLHEVATPEELGVMAVVFLADEVIDTVAEEVKISEVEVDIEMEVEVCLSAKSSDAETERETAHLVFNRTTQPRSSGLARARVDLNSARILW